MRKQWVMGNWKMNGNQESIRGLLEDIVRLSKPESLNSQVIFPPAIYLPTVRDLLKETDMAWGAQNVFPQEKGAYTGEVSGPMLKDMFCKYVLVGHSERRHLFHEDEKFIAEKFHHVKEHGMIPVLCVGETLEQRENGLTEQVISSQLNAIAEKGQTAFRYSIIAHEPVWAIGTGQTATPEQAQAVHAYIRGQIEKFDTEGANSVSILYGGSVNEHNAQQLFAMPDVDGGLVGGASLNAEKFVEIVKCIN